MNKVFKAFHILDYFTILTASLFHEIENILYNAICSFRSKIYNFNLKQTYFIVHYIDKHTLYSTTWTNILYSTLHGQTYFIVHYMNKHTL